VHTRSAILKLLVTALNVSLHVSVSAAAHRSCSRQGRVVHWDQNSGRQSASKNVLSFATEVIE